jgi:hypothetical protein
MGDGYFDQSMMPPIPDQAAPSGIGGLEPTDSLWERIRQAMSRPPPPPPVTPGVPAQGLGLGTGATEAAPLPGVTPPPGMPPVQGLTLPPTAKPFAVGGDPMTAGGDYMNPGAVGAALGAGGVPLPRPRPMGLGGPTDLSAAGGGGALEGPTTLGGPGGPTPFAPKAGGGMDEKKAAGIASALKGLAAPAPPKVQTVSSPNAPRPTGTIKAGELQALLMALNAAPGAGGIRLPSTLGSALGR